MPQDEEREREEEQRGFKVTDRRRFDGSGVEREDDEPGAPRGVDDNELADVLSTEAGSADGPTQQSGELPAIDFSTFVISLTTSALMHLGEAPEMDQTAVANLPLAKQTIDIVGMLQQKTAGNLSDDEEKLLNQVLYDLRVRYIARARNG